jgi:hypothetical protein
MGLPAPVGVSASGLPPAGDMANAVVAGLFTQVGPTAPFAFRGPMNVEIVAALVDALTTVAGSLDATVAEGAGLAAGDAIASALVPFGATIGTIDGAAITLALPPVTLYGFAQPGGNTIEGLINTVGLVGASVTGPGIQAGTTVLEIIQPAITRVGTQGAGLSPFQPGIVQLSQPVTAGQNPANIAVPFVFSRNGNAITQSGTDAAATFQGAAITYTGTVQLERSFTGGQFWALANIGGSGTLAQYSAGTPVNFSFGEPERNVLYRLNCTALTSGTIRYRLSETGGAAESLAIPLLT